MQLCTTGGDNKTVWNTDKGCVYVYVGVCVYANEYGMNVGKEVGLWEQQQSCKDQVKTVT